MKFKYNGRIYNPVNVEKKLKKMGITMEDIEILPDEKKKEDNSVEDYQINKRQVIVRSTEDDIRRVCFIDKDKSLPTISELFKNHIWNSETKTGIKGMTREFLMTMYYDIGII
jgi:hypothetical protein